PTPAADAERVYVVFGSAVIAALDHNGKLVWRKEITPYKFDVALAASPVLFGDTVILQCDQLDRQSRLVAFDRQTGEMKRTGARVEVRVAHRTPLRATIGGKTVLLASASNAIQGIDPATGKVLWSCEAKGDTVSPVLGGGLVYCDSGRGGPGFAVDPTGSGGVTKKHPEWKLPQAPEGDSPPVAGGGHLYPLRSPRVLECASVA